MPACPGNIVQKFHGTCDWEQASVSYQPCGLRPLVVPRPPALLAEQRRQGNEMMGGCCFGQCQPPHLVYIVVLDVDLVRNNAAFSQPTPISKTSLSPSGASPATCTPEDDLSMPERTHGLQPLLVGKLRPRRGDEGPTSLPRLLTPHHCSPYYLPRLCPLWVFQAQLSLTPTQSLGQPENCAGV